MSCGFTVRVRQNAYLRLMVSGGVPSVVRCLTVVGTRGACGECVSLRFDDCLFYIYDFIIIILAKCNIPEYSYKYILYLSI